MDLAPKVETGALWIACLLKQYKMNILPKASHGKHIVL